MSVYYALRLRGFDAFPSLLAALASWGIVLAVVFAANGCGASPVRVNATANSVAVEALGALQRVVLADVDRDIAACANDVPCLNAAEREQRAGAVVLDGFRGVVLLHREAVEIGAVREDGDALRETLRRAWALVTAEYDAALRWLQLLGVDVGVLGALPEVM